MRTNLFNIVRYALQRESKNSDPPHNRNQFCGRQEPTNFLIRKWQYHWNSTAKKDCCQFDKQNILVRLVFPLQAKPEGETLSIADIWYIKHDKDDPTLHWWNKMAVTSWISSVSFDKKIQGHCNVTASREWHQQLHRLWMFGKGSNTKG